jgi:tetratricopeptide (TPR) repeat protein
VIERGASQVLAAVEAHRSEIELLAGAPSTAVAAAEESCRLHTELGQLAELSTAAGGLAQAQYELGLLEDAEKSADRAAELGAPDDATTQMLWRQTVAKVLARRGELAEAERLAREAVAIGAKTDMLNAQADADADLGEVLVLAGRAEEAAEAFERALSRYEAKENVVMAGRARERLAELGAEVG